MNKLSIIERLVVWFLVIAGAVITASLALNFAFLVGWL